MTFTKRRLMAIIPTVIGAFLAIDLARGLSAQPIEGGVTALGVALNLAPSVILLTAGVAMLTQPRPGVVAFWLAPAWGPAFGWVWAVYDARPYPALVAMGAAVAAYLGMLIVARPGFALLRARNWNGLVPTATAGAATGAFISYGGCLLLVLANEGMDAGWSVLLRAVAPWLLAASVAVGALVGATSWAIVRPDRLAAARLGGLFT